MSAETFDFIRNLWMVIVLVLHVGSSLLYLAGLGRLVEIRLGDRHAITAAERYLSAQPGWLFYTQVYAALAILILEAGLFARYLVP